ncbi:hypothetical protein Pmani_038302 [Petrolisthes manimaculis]|uniref:Uncharacterized protein n=1 Tax=Petrolisthes manimaculis TaxID=1843537 RepID=A0AAE1TKJ9_9EUCA|nr:hypothetical protein Pmani_038302 [Petrolisthes manimaculis]
MKEEGVHSWRGGGRSTQLERRKEYTAGKEEGVHSWRGGRRTQLEERRKEEDTAGGEEEGGGHSWRGGGRSTQLEEGVHSWRGGRRSTQRKERRRKEYTAGGEEEEGVHSWRGGYTRGIIKADSNETRGCADDDRYTRDTDTTPLCKQILILTTCVMCREWRRVRKNEEESKVAAMSAAEVLRNTQAL